MYTSLRCGMILFWFRSQRYLFSAAHTIPAILYSAWRGVSMKCNLDISVVDSGSQFERRWRCSLAIRTVTFYYRYSQINQLRPWYKCLIFNHKIFLSWAVYKQTLLSSTHGHVRRELDSSPFQKINFGPHCTIRSTSIKECDYISTFHTYCKGASQLLHVNSTW
jgi:hypothetical protein